MDRHYSFQILVLHLRLLLISDHPILNMTVCVCVCLGERAEGAERKPENTTRTNGQKSTTLEEGVRRLSLQHTEKSETKMEAFSAVAPLLLLNSV